MNYLPILLLISTLTVRALIWRRQRLAFALDACSIPFWSYFYIAKDAPILVAVPLLFGFLDVQSWRYWGRK